ncbi:MAG: hypothetical protein MI975_25835, partial [Cytophagales bacterium]|nr:hypothetical protein [Cytophagales bacterium]
MPKKQLYFFILLLVININPLSAQEAAKYDYAKEEQKAEQSTNELQEKAIDLQKKADTLLSKTNQILSHPADTINKLPNHLETKVRARIDSLQKKLDELKTKAVDNEVTEKGQHITNRIDSLQNTLNSKLKLDKLKLYTHKVPDGEVINKVNTADLKVVDKLSIPGLSKIGVSKTGANNLSIPDTGLQSLTARVNEQLGNSKSWLDQDLHGVQQYTNQVSQHTGIAKDPSKIDQAIDSKAAQMSEFSELNEQTKALDEMYKLSESMLKDLQRYQNEQAMKETAKSDAKDMAIEQAKDHFANHQDKLSEAQSMMTMLKKKYSYVPDSRDLSTAVKATSLKNEPLKKRLVFGLGFQLHQTDPVSLDLAPHVMYKFSKLFAAGLSGTYRASLGIENNRSAAVTTSEDVYGAGAMAQHMVWKGFFGHLEFQYLSTPAKDPATGTDLPTRTWHEGLPVGIGKQVTLSKALRGQIIFTYDFLHTS